jgi:hypothetical protein
LRTVRDAAFDVFRGEYDGISFPYPSADRDHGGITELFGRACGEDQRPDAVYP